MTQIESTPYNGKRKINLMIRKSGERMSPEPRAKEKVKPSGTFLTEDILVLTDSELVPKAGCTPIRSIIRHHAVYERRMKPFQTRWYLGLTRVQLLAVVSELPTFLEEHLIENTWKLLQMAPRFRWRCFAVRSGHDMR